MAFLLLAGFPATAAADEVDGDERTVRQAGLNPDAAALLEHFRRQIPAAEDLRKARELVAQLGSEDFAQRERASAALVALGQPGRPVLRAALADRDLEVAYRAGVCLERIAPSHDPVLLEACARLLARRPPPGTVSVLLDFLPCAEEPALVDEVSVVLTRAGVRDGAAHPALVAALHDPLPLKRALAGEALARGGATAQRAALLRLLQDPDLRVRERVALALLAAHEREAVPVLIRLMGELPRTRRWPIEEALTRLAGEQAPPVSKEEEEKPGQRQAAWEAWWQREGRQVDLARYDANRPLGYTLLTVVDLRARLAGRVLELDAAGQQRWQIGGLRNPVDAQILGPDRVLIAESTTRQVTERNLKGEILWVYDAPGYLVGARRLRTGATVIVTRDEVIDLDRDGREVSRIPCPDGNRIVAAVRLPNRQTGVATMGGDYTLFDARGQVVRSFSLNTTLYPTGCGIDVLPNGHVLLPLYTGEVVEVDTAGKVVWRAEVPSPTSVQRLPNGNVLVGSRNGDVVELDKDGKVVGELSSFLRVQRASRR